MSNSSSPQPAWTAVPTMPHGRDPGNGHPAPGEPVDQQEWDELVAHEAMHQEVIEASFDRAEAYERVGDYQQALEWLDRAAGLGGRLPRHTKQSEPAGSGPPHFVRSRQRARENRFGGRAHGAPAA